jgi:hypothetical protein
VTAHPQTIAAQPALEPDAPLTAAERMRRHRDRRRRQVRYVGVELREAEVVTLIRRGFLKTEMRNDRNAVIQALHRFLDRALQ